MFFGTHLLRTACNGPCAPGDVAGLYQTPFSSFADDRIKAMCTSIESGFVALANDELADVSCSRQGAWFAAFGDETLCSGPTSKQPKCTSGFLRRGNEADQISMFHHFINSDSPERYRARVRALSDTWITGPAVISRDFTEAAATLKELSELCKTGDCRFGAYDDQSEIFATLLANWIEYFRTADFSGSTVGCAAKHIGYTGDQWLLKNGYRCNPGEVCLSFGPSSGLDGLATLFADKQVERRWAP